jgi:hypothetical protein
MIESRQERRLRVLSRIIEAVQADTREEAFRIALSFQT